jgi:hypothetical protein
MSQTSARSTAPIWRVGADKRRRSSPSTRWRPTHQPAQAAAAGTDAGLAMEAPDADEGVRQARPGRRLRRLSITTRIVSRGTARGAARAHYDGQVNLPLPSPPRIRSPVSKGQRGERSTGLSGGCPVASRAVLLRYSDSPAASRARFRSVCIERRTILPSRRDQTWKKRFHTSASVPLIRPPSRTTSTTRPSSA